MKQPSITLDMSRMDDLQLKVSSSDRYIVRRNGDLGLDPVVRRIRDLTMLGSSHERERTIPSSLRCNHKRMSGGLRKHMRDKQVFQETV